MEEHILLSNEEVILTCNTMLRNKDGICIAWFINRCTQHPYRVVCAQYTSLHFQQMQKRVLYYTRVAY